MKGVTIVFSVNENFVLCGLNALYFFFFLIKGVSPPDPRNFLYSKQLFYESTLFSFIICNNYSLFSVNEKNMEWSLIRIDGSIYVQVIGDIKCRS